MDIVVKSRHCTPSTVFREVAHDKLGKLERFNHPVARIDVELSRERAPRQSATCEKVELTLIGKGPVVRAEAQAADPVSALDLAISKVEARLRRLTGRRKATHTHGTRPVESVRRGAPSTVPDLPAPPPVDRSGVAAGVTSGDAAPGAGAPAASAASDGAATAVLDRPAPEVDDGTGDGPFVVREKVHAAEPMTRDQALERMELVGHDFYLYVCSATGMPSVVYRRHAYDYGVLHLAVPS